MSSDKPKQRKEKINDPDTENQLREERNEKAREEEMEEYDKKKRAKDKQEVTKHKQKPYKLPIWQRLLNLILGIVFIGLSFYALSNETITINTAILIFGGILLFSGLSRVIDAFYDKDIGGTTRIIRFIIAVAIITLAIIVIAFPGIGDNLLYGLLGIGLIIQGSGRFFTSITHTAYPLWVKIVKVALGVASVIIGVTAVLPTLLMVDLNVTLLTLLVIGFFISGLSRVISGLIGLGSKKQGKDK